MANNYPKVRFTTYIRYDQYNKLIDLKKTLREKHHYGVSLSELIRYSIDFYLGTKNIPNIDNNQNNVQIAYNTAVWRHEEKKKYVAMMEARDNE